MSWRTKAVKAGLAGFLLLLVVAGGAWLLLAWHARTSAERCATFISELESGGESFDPVALSPNIPSNGEGQKFIAAIEAIHGLMKEAPRVQAMGVRDGKFMLTHRMDEITSPGNPATWEAIIAHTDRIAGPFAAAVDALRRNPTLKAEPITDFSSEIKWMGEFMTFGQAAQLMALRALREGRIAEAVAANVAMIEASLLARRQPALICALVAISIQQMAFATTWEILQAAPLDMAALDALKAAWERADAGRNLSEALRLERAVGLKVFDHPPDRLFSAFEWAGEAPVEPAPASLNLMLRFWHAFLRHDDKRALVETYQRLIDTAPSRMEPPDFRDIISMAEQIRNEAAKVPLWAFVTRLALPSMDGIVSRAAVASASRSLALAAIGIAQYQLHHGGQPPPDLEALGSDYLGEVPMDPWTGGPLSYSPRHDGGFRLYAVGVNLEDDGGEAELGRSPTSRHDPTRWLDFIWPTPPN